MGIEAGQTQYLLYKNNFIMGQCKSRDSVLITWPSGFTDFGKADIWDKREFLAEPAKARVLAGNEAEKAKAFFEALGQKHTTPHTAGTGTGAGARKP